MGVPWVRFFTFCCLLDDQIEENQAAKTNWSSRTRTTSDALTLFCAHAQWPDWLPLPTESPDWASRCRGDLLTSTMATGQPSVRSRKKGRRLSATQGQSFRSIGRRKILLMTWRLRRIHMDIRSAWSPFITRHSRCDLSPSSSSLWMHWLRTRRSVIDFLSDALTRNIDWRHCVSRDGSSRYNDIFTLWPIVWFLLRQTTLYSTLFHIQFKSPVFIRLILIIFICRPVMKNRLLAK